VSSAVIELRIDSTAAARFQHTEHFSHACSYVIPPEARFDCCDQTESPLDDRCACGRGRYSGWVLAERFCRYLGEPQLAYLTRWRLQLRSQMLCSTSLAPPSVLLVGDINNEVVNVIFHSVQQGGPLPTIGVDGVFGVVSYAGSRGQGSHPAATTCPLIGVGKREAVCRTATDRHHSSLNRGT
jgi:hypothetical protein